MVGPIESIHGRRHRLEPLGHGAGVEAAAATLGRVEGVDEGAEVRDCVGRSPHRQPAPLGERVSRGETGGTECRPLQ